MKWHHVQDQLGLLGKANTVRRQPSTTDSNGISVRIGLQADCYSGIWAHYTNAGFSRGKRRLIWPLVTPSAQIICEKPNFLLVKPTARLDILCKARLIWIIAVATNQIICVINA